MSTEPMWRRYARLWGPDVRADVAEEMEFHIQMRADEYVRQGMDPGAAHARAVEEFGDMARARAECEEIGGVREHRRKRAHDIASLVQDVRHAVRRLRKAPGFTLITVLTLALGIGATTAIFSVVNGVLLRPLPYAQPDRLVQIFETFPLSGGAVGERGSVSYPNYRDWVAQSHSFDGLAIAGWPGSLNLQGEGDPERLPAIEVSAELLPLLGVRPLRGRLFSAEEDQLGSPQVALIGERLWRRRFGADPGVLGRKLTLDGEPYTVVGILPERVRFGAFRGEAMYVYVPMRLKPDVAQNRGRHWMQVIGRLKPGVSIEAAKTELAGVAARLAQQYPDAQEGRSVHILSLREATVGSVRPALLVLLGAAGLLLLIACANAASLLLARAVARRREVAVLSALGASRGRVAQQFLVESLLLSLGGAVVGVLLARWGLAGIVAGAGRLLPRAAEIGFDGRVAGFLVAITVLTALFFGVVPAVQAARANLQSDLREGGRGGSAGRAGQRFRGALVVGQIALSLVLLVGAGLLLRTFVALLGTETGMATEHVLTVKIPLSTARYDSAGVALTRFYEPVLQQVRALPGVTAAGTTTHLPLREFGTNGNFGIVGKTYPSVAEQPFAEMRVVSPGYFASLGIPVRRGRDFGAQDAPDGMRVAVVNEALARRYFPGQDPVGQRMTGLGDTPVQIVGVVGDVREQRLDQPPVPELYFPYTQQGWWGLAQPTLVVRTTLPPTSVARQVTGVIRGVDPNQPVFHVQAMDEVIAESLSSQRLYVWLLGIFAAVALVLAMAGIYGVISYSVGQRTREFGIRLALGSDSAGVRRLVVRQGAILAVLGLAVGVPAALALARLATGLLYEVKPSDATTYLVVAGVLAAVALAASWIPARRVTRVDPSIALRTE